MLCLAHKIQDRLSVARVVTSAICMHEKPRRRAIPVRRLQCITHEPGLHTLAHRQSHHRPAIESVGPECRRPPAFHDSNRSSLGTAACTADADLDARGSCARVRDRLQAPACASPYDPRAAIAASTHVMQFRDGRIKDRVGDDHVEPTVLATACAGKQVSGASERRGRRFSRRGRPPEPSDRRARPSRFRRARCGRFRARSRGWRPSAPGERSVPPGRSSGPRR